MAGFETHIAVSTMLGAGYAVAGHWEFHQPLPTCAIAGGLCSLGGMLPDLDSDSGVPFRETLSLAAAIAPMLFFPRLHHWGFTVEQMVLVGAPVYLFMRFVIGGFLREFTVHRGMFHSIPALAIAGMIAYLVCGDGDQAARVFKAGGVCLGFLSHLLLDELYSVEATSLGPRLKKSAGTAIKFFGNDPAANAGCWGLMLLLGLVTWKEYALSGPIAIAAPQRVRAGESAGPGYEATDPSRRESYATSGTPSQRRTTNDRAIDANRRTPYLPPIEEPPERRSVRRPRPAPMREARDPQLDAVPAPFR